MRQSVNIGQRGGLINHWSGKVYVFNQLITARPFFLETRPCTLLQITALGRATIVGLVWVDAPFRILRASRFVLWKFNEFYRKSSTNPIRRPVEKDDRLFTPRPRFHH